MSGVVTRTVAEDEAGIRVDRWFKRHYPDLGHGRLEKLLRTGQVRVDGGRVKAGDRLASGQAVRVPPLTGTGAGTGAMDGTETSDPTPRPVARAAPARHPRAPSAADEAFMRDLILVAEDDAFVLNKPPGLAVQGGTGMARHVDGLLDALRFGAAERPRLIHRLDKDTSGVLVIARSASAAEHLSRAFQGRAAHKVYWAVTAGVPRPMAGTIDLALAKLPGRGPGGAHERVVAVEDEEEAGKRAVSDYIVLAHAGKSAALVALRPRTGRTHQLRAHMAAIGTPILGDGKYGGAAARVEGAPSQRLHLHARAIRLPRAKGRPLEAVAPPPDMMAATMRFFGFDVDLDIDPHLAFRDAPGGR